MFAQSWGYVWNRLENDADTKVKGKVGVTILPHDKGGKSATCIGGWQLAVSAFSKNKQEAVKFVRYLSSPEVSKMQAIMASHLPVFPEVYKDPEVLKANPWFADALPVVETAKSRPVSAQYPQVSDAIRSNMNAYLAGTKTTIGAERHEEPADAAVSVTPRSPAKTCPSARSARCCSRRPRCCCS